MKLVHLAVAAITTAVLVSADAAADQCGAVTPDQADLAAAILQRRLDVRLHCAPCGDRDAKALSVSRATHEKRHGFHMVVVRDAGGREHELDLAYTYVRLNPRKDVFENLAALVGCPAVDVPPRIDAEGGALP